MIIKNSQHKWIISLIIVLLILSFMFGTIVGILKYPPTNLLKISYKLITNKYNEYDKFYPEYLNTNVSSLISIENKNDVIKKRNRLIQYVWKDEGFPVSKLPDDIDENIKDSRYSDLDNLKSIDKIIVTMDYGLNSVVYHFHPIKENGELVIYHQGHNGDFILGKKTIQFFLNNGYSVMAFTMPLVGMNNIPTANTEFGEIKLGFHRAFWLLDSQSFSAIKFFLEPITVSLNYLERNFNYKQIAMVGISGGGWTTNLYSAVDARISRSYSVAGVSPFYIQALPPQNSFLHYEYILPELYKIANNLELYILGSYGENRKQIQILNKYDSVCCGGIGYLTYEGEIKKIMNDLEGEFEVYLDDTHREHKISDTALNVILNDLEN